MIHGDNRIEYRAELAAPSLERGNENVTLATIVDLETNQTKLGVGQAGGGGSTVTIGNIDGIITTDVLPIALSISQWDWGWMYVGAGREDVSPSTASSVG